MSEDTDMKRLMARVQKLEESLAGIGMILAAIAEDASTSQIVTSLRICSHLAGRVAPMTPTLDPSPAFESLIA